MSVKLLVVGGGKMGSALVGGLLRRGWARPPEIIVVEPDAARRSELAAEHAGLGLQESLAQPTAAGAVAAGALPAVAASPGVAAGAAGAAGAILAVKPEVAESACRLLGEAGIARIVSIVAGIPAGRLEASMPAGAVVVRAMPNTPALVGAGVTVISGGSHASAADLDWAEDVLRAVGAVVRLPERYLDAVTGVSGCGPAYVFMVAESLIEAAVLVGLPRDLSRTLVVETLLGSAKLLAETGESPESLRAAVTSPGGATAAGLRALESRAVRSAFVEAVASATERSRNLGR